MANKPLNMLLSWDKNLNPDLKVCSAAATYSRDTKLPSAFYGRLFFWSYDDAILWASILPKWVGVRVKVFPIKQGDKIYDLGVIRLDINIAGRAGLSSNNGLDRYKRYISTVEADGYKIDWQSPSYVLRAYRDRAAFEAALRPAPIRQYKDDTGYAAQDRY